MKKLLIFAAVAAVAAFFLRDTIGQWPGFKQVSNYFGQ